MVEIVIDGYAQPNQSPQAHIIPPLPPGLRNRHHAAVYKPQEVRKWQVFAKHQATEQMKGKSPYAGALTVVVHVFLPVPVSLSKKKRHLALTGAIRPITRPDVDNFIKAIFDSLNGVCWYDDAQVVDLHAAKMYSDKPRVQVRVEQQQLFVEQPPLFRDHDART
jgi:Holliday junction resolvase RusA-like endonuclease